jgi:flavin reductase (DIM6/NTAB) family NADH-FMN oxidoreductase RutF
MSTPMPIDPSTFRATLGRFASGITVITARDAEGRDVGMTVSAFTSLSLDPPLVLISIDNGASVAPALEQCEYFGINVLSEEQEPLSRRFSGKDIDRFEGVAYHRGQHEVALLDGALANLECRVHARYPGGDHTILVGAVEATAVREGHPLLYYRGGYARLDR